MTTTHEDEFEIVRGTGNVFRDFGYANADAEHLKAVLAAQIIGVLDTRELTVRKAAELTGIAAADFSRIRQAKLDRFTVDRLMRILDRLDRDVRVKVSVAARPEHLPATIGRSTRRFRPALAIGSAAAAAQHDQNEAFVDGRGRRKLNDTWCIEGL